MAAAQPKFVEPSMADPLNAVLDGDGGQGGEARRVVGQLADDHRPAAAIDHRNRQGVLVTVDSCEHARPLR
jgi:hypothetical protein